MNNLGAIILAAGRGTRMQSTDVNKVALPLGNKPMIRRVVDQLGEIGIKPVIAVVGFAKESVVNSLSGTLVVFAQQEEPKGTGHAVVCALEKVPEDIEHVLVMNGDDSAFYTKEILSKLISKHFESDADVTLLTTEKDNPFGLGRIIRDKNGQLIDIIEEKNATEEQRLITEVNPGCYIFRVSFLNQFKESIKKNELTGEYYINNFIELAIINHKKVETVKLFSMPWRGVNTGEELKEAQELYAKTFSTGTTS